ncbi:hypothetical protein ACXJJ3_24055 [Kribbella sp. WER1]
MDEPVSVNAICPECDGNGVIRVSRGVVSLDTNEGGWASVLETCKTCQGDGKLKGFQPPV